MNFKFKTFSLLCAGLVMGLTACNNDDLLEGNQNAEGSGRYFHVQAGISLPSQGGYRSATDSVGDNGGQTNSNADKDFEEAYDYENEIRTMILVYADGENNYITHSVVKGITKAPVSGTSYDYVVDGEIAHENLEEAYKTGGVLADYNPANDDIHVFAICNYTARLEEYFKGAKQGETGTTWLEWVGTVEEDPSPAASSPSIHNTIWAKRSFLMTNYAIAKVKFPGTIDEWDDYADKNNPWLLNKTGDQQQIPSAIEVERSAARMDFRDASNSKLKETAATDVEKAKWSNTYDLLLHPNSYGDQVDTTTNNSGAYNIVSIKLTRMALVNMSKNFYYLRRVADDAALTNLAICGPEYQKFDKDGKVVAGNFVVDTDWTDKNKKTGMEVTTEHANFNFPLYTTEVDETTGLHNYNRAGWYVSNIDDVLEGEADQWNSTPGAGRYKIWRYLTENTMPTAESQVTGQSTGVIFKGKIVKGADIGKEEADKYVSKALINALDSVSLLKNDAEAAAYTVLYSFENRLFAGPEDIIAGAVQDGENSALYGAVSKVLSAWKLDETTGVYKYKGDGDIELDVKVANEILTGDEKAEGLSIEKGTLTDINFCASNKPTETQIAQFHAENYDGDGYGYYCFYFYWNRHNDNSKSGLMGNMEFASVRNNVYKLAVTKIERVGHPTIPSDDPDPEKPDTPDEPPTNYIRVQVDVLPWVVRENNIEF